nr:DNA-directed RNA polymerase subunit alpha C-terminal domain-containing protein [Parabacteroides goldsteinii]
MTKKTYLTKKRLQSRIEELESAVNSIAVKSKGLEYENARLKRLLYKSFHIGLNADDIDQYNLSYVLPEEAIKELSLSIHCLELSTRVRHGLLGLDIRTLADLLREIRDYKMQRIKEARMLGKKSIAEIVEAMRKKGWVDQYNRCYLFEYL